VEGREARKLIWYSWLPSVGCAVNRVLLVTCCVQYRNRPGPDVRGNTSSGIPGCGAWSCRRLLGASFANRRLHTFLALSSHGSSFFLALAGCHCATLWSERDLSGNLPFLQLQRPMVMGDRESFTVPNAAGAWGPKMWKKRPLPFSASMFSVANRKRDN